MKPEDIALLIITNTLKKDSSKVKNPKKLKWDSLQHINIISNLEMEFDITFEPEEISEMVNIDRINETLLSKLKQKE